MKWILAAMLFTLVASAQEVIDLGSLKIEGAARGPEVYLIDTNQLDDNSAEKIVLEDLKRLEKELLGNSLPERVSGKAKGNRKP